MPFLTNLNNSVCLDIGYRVTLVDRDWLAKKLSSQKIITMPVLLKVKGISAFKHELEKFILTMVYILGFDGNGYKVYVSIICELHLVDGLKANMLVENDVLCI